MCENVTYYTVENVIYFDISHCVQTFNYPIISVLYFKIFQHFKLEDKLNPQVNSTCPLCQTRGDSWTENKAVVHTQVTHLHTELHQVKHESC